MRRTMLAVAAAVALGTATIATGAMAAPHGRWGGHPGFGGHPGGFAFRGGRGWGGG